MIDPHMDTVTILGFFAGALTTLSFAPQAIKAWRSRSTADLSFAMLLLLLAGVLLWFVYGAARGDLAIIVANGATAILVAFTLALKAQNG